MRKINWKKYTFEFLSIFVAVVSAFMLTSWNENRNDKNSELNILTEIKNGIDLDTKDFQGNILNYNLSLRANQVFRDLIELKPIPQDSIQLYYIALYRDYTALVHRSGYESLKESGLKTITNDSLRLQIITLYDYHYGIITLLDEVHEMQSFKNYFSSINDLLHPYMEFDNKGNLIKITEPIGLSKIDKKKILSYLWRLENNRKFKLGRYKSIIQVMGKVQSNIGNEISEN